MGGKLLSGTSGADRCCLQNKCTSSPEVLDSQGAERDKPLSPSVSGTMFLPSSLAVQMHCTLSQGPSLDPHCSLTVATEILLLQRGLCKVK